MLATAPAAPVLNAILRRFCECEATCVCGLPRPQSGWTVARLIRLRELMREHGSLAVAAEALGESRSECNLALDIMLDRTPVHALAKLEARAER